MIAFRKKHTQVLASLASLTLLAGTICQAADIKTGLKAYWSFDNKDFKDSVGVFEGTAMGSAPIPFVAGKSGFGQALELDGEDQYVEITGGEPDDLAFEGGSISISAWFTVNSFDTSWQALVAKGEGSNWRVARNGSNSTMSYAGGLTDATGTIDVTDGAWHHIVAISDANGANFGTAIYVDGKLDGTIAGAAALTANGSRVRIGENPGATGREWDGKIDDVAIWDRVLTEAEIASLWNNGTGKPLSAFFAPPNDTDNDGMPNDWETQYGLNPNDPSDAAKDANNNGITNLNEYKAGYDPTDTVNPTVTSIKTTSTFDSVTITYSKPMDGNSATNVANYSISPSLAVTAASMKGNAVTLTTAKQTAGGTAYTVTVNNVKSVNNLPLAANTKATFFSYMLTKTGVLKYSYWTGISGTPVQNLYDDPRYPASPDGVGAVYSFNSRDYFPTDALENYGATMEGYLTPTENGDYRFFVYSDDASELYLSTDDKEANLVQIAFESGCCNNFTEPPTDRTSEPVALVANKKYFVRMVYKEGGGGDYGQIAWRKEGDATPAGSLRPIPGKFLSSAVDLPYPAEGVFTTQSPAPGAKNVSPDTSINLVHLDGKTPWTSANVSLKVDGAAVTPTFTKAGTEATIVYKPASLWASKSSHTVALSYVDPAGQPATMEWSFEVTEYKGPVVDKVKGYPALIMAGASQTDDKGGHTGAAGDRALDTGNAAGTAWVLDASFLNAATADNTLSVAFFQKIRAVRDSSSFWANSTSSASSTRGFQAHVPWSNANIYFDTSGCCDADITRINAGIDTFAGYTGDATWWQSWHHFAFVKDGETKRIYIDGEPFLEGGASAPLKTDFTSLVIGGGPGIADNRMNGQVDDFVVYNGALTAAQAKSLSGGAAPSSVPGLIAHWDFNQVQQPAANLTIARTGAGQVTVTYSGTLQSADAVAGPYTDVTGATSPYSTAASAAAKYFRARQ